MSTRKICKISQNPGNFEHISPVGPTLLFIESRLQRDNQDRSKIQIASKVCSNQSLYVHIFGKLVAAMFILILNS